MLSTYRFIKRLSHKGFKADLKIITLSAEDQRSTLSKEKSLLFIWKTIRSIGISWQRRPQQLDDCLCFKNIAGATFKGYTLKTYI
jgi:hypothetical protein